MGEKSIIKLSLGWDKLYLKSLFPIAWTEFISEAVWYESPEEARTKLNEQHYRLSVDLHEKNADIENIIIDTYVDGKFSSSLNYIGG